MTATGIPVRPSEKAKGSKVTGLRLLVGLTIALALAGVAIAALLVVRGTPAVTAVGVLGQPVDTGFGAFTVTSVTTTFVPDTQGPPTAAQHAGTNGTDQLQVSVRLVNEAMEKGLAYAPSQLRLVTDARSGHGQDPDGSSLKASVLPRGGSIDGRVWFNLPKGSKSSGVGWWLQFNATDGEEVRVPLDPPKVAPSTAAPREAPNLKHAPAGKH